MVARRAKGPGPRGLPPWPHIGHRGSRPEGPQALRLSPRKPTAFWAKGAFCGAPYGSTAECDRRQRPLAFASCTKRCFAPFGAKEHSCGRLTSPTGVRRRKEGFALFAPMEHRAKGPVRPRTGVGDVSLPHLCSKEHRCCKAAPVRLRGRSRLGFCPMELQSSSLK